MKGTGIQVRQPINQKIMLLPSWMPLYDETNEFHLIYYHTLFCILWTLYTWNHNTCFLLFLASLMQYNTFDIHKCLCMYVKVFLLLSEYTTISLSIFLVYMFGLFPIADYYKQSHCEHFCTTFCKILWMYIFINL